MKTSEIFDALLENLKVGDTARAVASRRDEIAKALNKDFRSKDGCTDYKLMIGSFGRHTAVKGVSDLDMIYILPSGIRSHYDGDTGPRRILERVRDDLKARYPNTSVRVDQCVVRLQFTTNAFKFEVQPALRTPTAASTIRTRRLRAGSSPSRARRSPRPRSATTRPRRTCGTWRE
ncbi:SMODS domain-containing nucleotidyltransferase [Glutamicibacter sp. AOP5-A2-7]